MTHPVRLMDTRDPGFARAFAALETRREGERASLQDAVGAIVADVRARGDAAVIDATERFDGYRLAPDQLVLSDAEIDAGARALGPADRQALELAAERVRRYHALRVPQSWRHAGDDEELGQQVRPLARVGLYAPGGVAPLASTVLMLGIPASVAGVPDLALASPGRTLPPAVLAAARLAGVQRVHPVGGAHAIAALAYGTEHIPRVDKVAGPGNVYVQEAKRQVLGQVAIDSEAGPSEVFIVAAPDAAPELLAADLLAQAEHDERSGVVLATPSAELARATLEQVRKQLAELPTAAVASRALADAGAIICTRDLDEALDLANRYAAEHLQLYVDDPEPWLARVEHAGAIFVGPYSPVPLGDYVAGPSHVLPTGGTARFSSVVGVEDFQKRSSVIRFGRAGFERVADAAIRLAELEGLHAHARAVQARRRGS